MFFYQEVKYNNCRAPLPLPLPLPLFPLVPTINVAQQISVKYVWSTVLIFFSSFLALLSLVIHSQPASQQLGSSVYLFRPLPKFAIRLLLVLLAAHSTHVILCSLFSPYISSLYVCLCVFLLSIRLSVSYLFAGGFYLVYSKFLHSIVKYAIVILMEHLFQLLTFPLIDNFPLNFYFLWQMKKNSRWRKKYTENKTDDFDSTWNSCALCTLLCPLTEGWVRQT